MGNFLASLAEMIKNSITLFSIKAKFASTRSIDEALKVCLELKKIISVIEKLPKYIQIINNIRTTK